MTTSVSSTIDRQPPTVSAGDRFVIPEDLSRDLKRRSGKGFPVEVCGLLLGRHVASSWRVEALTQGDNLVHDRQHDRFILDPQHYLEADRRAAEAGLEIIGVWHTHPNHPAVPSAMDREHAWEGFVYVIVSTHEFGAEEPRAWVFDGEQFEEIQGADYE